MISFQAMYFSKFQKKNINGSREVTVELVDPFQNLPD